jgi:hypothetical protein
MRNTIGPYDAFEGHLHWGRVAPDIQGWDRSDYAPPAPKDLGRLMQRVGYIGLGEKDTTGCRITTHFAIPTYLTNTAHLTITSNLTETILHEPDCQRLRIADTNAYNHLPVYRHVCFYHPPLAIYRSISRRI